MKTLKNLFLEELADRYDGEKQLVSAMPKMAAAATCSKLKTLIQSHLKQTEEHVNKLDKVFKAFGEKPTAKKCSAICGLIKEGEEIATSFAGSHAINAALISTAQKVEHYEIAAYGCLHEWAKDLKNEEAASILQGILTEEGDTNKALIELARASSNGEALSCCSPKAACNGKNDGHKSESLPA